MERAQLRNAYEAIEEAYGLLPVPSRELNEVLGALREAEYFTDDYERAYEVLGNIYEALAAAHDFDQKYG